jgi:hypothetical protein
LFDAIGENAERKRLCGRDSSSFCSPVSQYTRHVYNFGNPAPVGLKFCFDFVHNMRHACILARSHFCGIKVWLDFPNLTCRL